MKRGNGWLLSIAIIAILSTMISCTTLGQGANQPAWIDEYPQEEGYYIGIGSSDTGKRSADMDRARAQALSSLAAEISVELRAEISIEQREESGGTPSSLVRSRISQTMEQHLKEVETVDTYYSPQEGYWIYLRLNKTRWASIQRREMRQLAERVQNVVSAAEGSSAAGQLAAIGKALQLVRQSPYIDVLEGRVDGEEGVIFDILEARAARIIGDLRLEVEPRQIKTHPRQGANIRLAVQSAKGQTPGVWTVVITPREANGRKMETVITGADGRFSGRLKLEEFPLGLNRAMARLDIVRLGFTQEDAARLPVPVELLAIEKQPPRAFLLMSASGGAGVDGIRESVQAALSTPQLPFSLSAQKAAEADYVVEVTVTFRDLPKFSENAICFTKVRAVVTVLRNDSSIFSAELDEVKDGGIDFPQARQRAFNRLIQQLKENRELVIEMAAALDL